MGNHVPALGAQRRLHIQVISKLDRLLRLWDEDYSAEGDVCKAISDF